MSKRNEGRPGYKETQVGWIPDGWEIKKLNEISAIKTGPFGALLHARDYVERGTPIITVEHLTENGLKHENIPLVSDSDKSRLSPYILKAGDIVFSRVGSVDRNSLVSSNEEGWLFSGRLLRVRVNHRKILPNYLSYYFHQGWFTNYMNRIAVGGIMPSLNTSLLSNVPIVVPPLTEQQKIASILSIWDLAIQLMGKQIEAKQRLKKGLMQRLLTGRVRVQGFRNDWRRLSLSKLVKPIFRPEIVQSEKTYKLLGVKWYVAGPHIHEIVHGLEISSSTLSRVHENDIVYNKMWVTKQAFGIARKEHDGAYGSTEYPQFEVIDGKIDVNFMSFFFHNERFQYDALRKCKGTTGRARLNPSDFLRITISIPEIREQKAIATILRAYNKEINLLINYQEKITRQKNGLMQKLLTGEMRV